MRFHKQPVLTPVPLLLPPSLASPLPLVPLLSPLLLPPLLLHSCWHLPEDGALEVTPLNRNRVCHGYQSSLLQTIKRLTPGHRALIGEQLPLEPPTSSSRSQKN